MNDNGEPKVIEYNCRMGDPETEVVIPRIKNDLVELLTATTQQKLHEITIEKDSRSVAAVVAVSGGYPGDFKTGLPVLGLDNEVFQSSLMFHSATKIKKGPALLSPFYFGGEGESKTGL